MAIENNQAEKI